MGVDLGSFDYEVQMALAGWTAMIIAVFLIVYCVMFLLMLHLSGLGSADDDDEIERLICKDVEACLTFAYVTFLACMVCAGFDCYYFMLVKIQQTRNQRFIFVLSILWVLSIPLTAGWFYLKLRKAKRFISTRRKSKTDGVATEASLAPLFAKDESSD
jgi:hypothetical protein